jgi:hypothetical protein
MLNEMPRNKTNAYLDQSKHKNFWDKMQIWTWYEKIKQNLILRIKILSWIIIMCVQAHAQRNIKFNF